ncbi:MAG: hydrogenase formation protein HypD [Desulfomonilia bacterium]
MKFIDEYRDPGLSRQLLDAIQERARRIRETVTIMEVCGSHTMAIGRFGIRTLLPENIRLISGPGCPVCVTAINDVDTALWLASQGNVIFTTFGDMLKVPGTGGNTLQRVRSLGAHVEIVSSVLEAVHIARQHPEADVIFMAIGFETTSPTIASAVRSCSRNGPGNFSILSVHKLIPPAIRVLIEDPALKITGFLCPGHVSTIIGSDAYSLIPEHSCAAVIAGFEPVDILEGILMILDQTISRRFQVQNQYARAVNDQGNRRARALLDEVFTPVNSAWRGLGEILASGLSLKREYAAFDVMGKFQPPVLSSREPPGCRCGDVLKGLISPEQCGLFGRTCTPATPVGPCMVSSEGTCAAHYTYH